MGTSSFGSIDWFVSRLELIKASAPFKAIISSSLLMSAVSKMEIDKVNEKDNLLAKDQIP